MRFIDKYDDIRLLWLARFGMGKMLSDTRWIEKSEYDRKQILMRHGWNFSEAFDFCYEGSEKTAGDIDSAARRYAAAQAKLGNVAPQMAVTRDFNNQLRKSKKEQEEAKREAEVKQAIASTIADLFAGKLSVKSPAAVEKNDSLSHISEAAKIVEQAINKAVKKAQLESEREIVKEAIAANRNSRKEGDRDLAAEVEMTALIREEIQKNWDAKYRFIPTPFGRMAAAMNVVKAAIARGELKV